MACSFAVLGVALRHFGCSSGRKATPILTETALSAMQKGLSVYIGTIGLSALGLLPFRQTVAPRRRGTSLLGFEDAVELGARREATLGRDGVVAIVRIFAHHILRHLKTYAAKPYAEGAVLTLVKKLGEVPLGDAHVNPAKRNVLDLKNETCKNREKRNVLNKSHTRHCKAIKKQSRTGCFYSF